jgi:hypothetical protein
MPWCRLAGRHEARSDLGGQIRARAEAGRIFRPAQAKVERRAKARLYLAESLRIISPYISFLNPLKL